MYSASWIMTTTAKFRIVKTRSGIIKKGYKPCRNINKKSTVTHKHFCNLKELSDNSLLSQSNKRKRKTLNCAVNCVSSNKTKFQFWTNYHQDQRQGV